MNNQTDKALVALGDTFADATNQTLEQMAEKLAQEIAGMVVEPAAIPPGTSPSHEYLYGKRESEELASKLLPIAIRTLRTATEQEKQRRIYYQDIVYAVCNAIDVYNGVKPGSGLVCGTADSPSSEVQKAVAALIARARKVELERDEFSEDKADLDWLEKFLSHIPDATVAFNDDPDIDCEDSPDGLMPVGFRVCFPDACEPGKVFVESTLRQAIRAARNEGGKE